MRVLNVMMVCTALAFAATSAFAEVRGPKGEKCDEVKTRVSKQIDSKAYICDRCTVKTTDAKCEISRDAKSSREQLRCGTVTNIHFVNCEIDKAELEKQRKAEADKKAAEEAKKKAEADKKKAAEEAAKKKAADEAAKKKADAARGGKS